MVRAILDGRKSQTRQIIKPQPKHRVIEAISGVTVGMDKSRDGAIWYDADGINPGREIKCPHGELGDRLWVKETFSTPFKGALQWVYKANGVAPFKQWTSSILMPRAFSRITLEITAVRVERVMDITRKDVLAEGISEEELRHHGWYWKPYMLLWESINGEDSWNKNPWVWVIEFRRVTP